VLPGALAKTIASPLTKGVLPWVIVKLQIPGFVYVVEDPATAVSAPVQLPPVVQAAVEPGKAEALNVIAVADVKASVMFSQAALSPPPSALTFPFPIMGVPLVP
jgi:hypothetical protein